VTIGAGAIRAATSRDGSLRQLQLGLFLNKTVGRFHVMTELQRINTEGFASDRDSFTNFYAQMEWQVNALVTPYLRGERSFGDDFRPGTYQQYFPDAERSGVVGGLRLDFLKKFAAKLEVSTKENYNGDNERALAVEWSAMLP
jgi:hypothetical protein